MFEITSNAYTQCQPLDGWPQFLGLTIFYSHHLLSRLGLRSTFLSFVTKQENGIYLDQFLTADFSVCTIDQVFYLIIISLQNVSISVLIISLIPQNVEIKPHPPRGGGQLPNKCRYRCGGLGIRFSRD